jgi:ActR/RegA family two-component response regulator
MKPCQENPMKAMILRDDAADAVQTSRILASKGFQTLCVTSRDIAQAMIRADVIDLMVMDERIGTQLTHTLALSAERRNPFVSTIIMTDQGAGATDELYELIPSLYALIGTRTEAEVLGKVFLAAVANTEEAARRIDRHLAADAAEMDGLADDVDQIEDDDQTSIWDDDDDEADDDDTADAAFAVPALQEIASDGRRGWGNYADVRPHLVTPVPVNPPSDEAIRVCA